MKMTLKEWMAHPLKKEDIIINTQVDPLDEQWLNINNSPYIPEPIGICQRLQYHLDDIITPPPFGKL